MDQYISALWSIEMPMPSVDFRWLPPIILPSTGGGKNYRRTTTAKFPIANRLPVPRPSTSTSAPNCISPCCPEAPLHSVSSAIQLKPPLRFHFPPFHGTCPDNRWLTSASVSIPPQHGQRRALPLLCHWQLLGLLRRYTTTTELVSRNPLRPRQSRPLGTPTNGWTSRSGSLTVSLSPFLSEDATSLTVHVYMLTLGEAC